MNALFENLTVLLDGLRSTILLAVAAGLGSIIIGVLVTAARVSPIPLLRAAAFGYVQFFINIPLLALLILAIFALPEAGFLLPVIPTVAIVLTVYESAYVAEAVRSGINTVPVGQVEAARALGLTFTKSMRFVVVPQAFRAVVQPIGNVMISLVMNTSLAAVVGVVELTSRINSVNLVYAQPVFLYTVGGLIYMLLALVIGLTTGWFERKLAILR